MSKTIEQSKVKGVTLQKSTGKWVAYYYDSNGKRCCKGGFGMGEKGRKAAEEFKLGLDLDKRRGREIKAPNQQGIYDIAQEYIDHTRAAGKSQHFINQMVSLINKHIGPLIDHKPVERLSEGEIVGRLMDYYQKRGTGLRTIQKHIRYLRTIFRFAVKRRLIDSNPLEHWQNQKHAPRVHQLTLEDLEKIMDHAAPHLRWALEVEYNLGTRPGRTELFALKWTDVDFDRGTVTVYRSKTKRYDQLMPSQTFMRRLWERKQESESGYLVEFRGKPVKQLASAWKTAKRRAGITYRLPMYDIRHLFASIMLSNGAPLSGVSRAMGHSEISTTMKHYYHLLGGEVEAAMATLPEIGSGRKKAGKVVKLTG